MNNTCDVCDSKVGWTNPALELSDATVCNNCLPRKQLTFKETALIKTMKLDDFKDRIKGYKSDFNATTEIPGKMKINETDQQILFIPNTVVSFKDIIGYELLEDDETVVSGGIGRAVVGGTLFGGSGAVVGAVTGKKTGTCSNLRIKVTLDSISNPVEYIKFIDKKTKKNKREYKDAVDQAQKCLSILQVIADRNK